jgi:hypothetical protein
MADEVEAFLLAQYGYISSNQPMLLNSQVLLAPAASVTYTVVTPFPRIQCFWSASCSNATTTQQIWLQYNGDAGSNYLWQKLEINTASVAGTGSSGTAIHASVGSTVGTSVTADYWSSGDFVIDGANQSAHYATHQGKYSAFAGTSSTFVGIASGQHNVLGVVTSVTLTPNAGNFVAGSSFSFYGLT